MAPVELGAGSEGLMSRVSADWENICKFLRHVAGDQGCILRALEQLEDKLFGPLNGVRMAVWELHMKSRERNGDWQAERRVGVA